MRFLDTFVIVVCFLLCQVMHVLERVIMSLHVIILLAVCESFVVKNLCMKTHFVRQLWFQFLAQSMLALVELVEMVRAHYRAPKPVLCVQPDGTPMLATRV